jgi:hypothetical protein
MNDLEERVRADLMLAAVDVEDRVDADEVLGAGRRLRRGRRITRAVGVAALVVVVAMGWTALRLPPPGLWPPVAGSVTAVPSVGPTPTPRLSTTFDLSEQGMDGKAPAYRSITVTARPAGADVVATVVVRIAGEAPDERTFTFRAGTTWHIAWDRNLAIGIVPDDVLWLEAKDGVLGGIYSDERPLDGIGGTAFWRYYSTAGGAEAIGGLVWQSSDGVVRNSRGAVVPSASFDLRSTTMLVYRDEGLDLFGLRGPRPNEALSMPLSDVKEADIVGSGLGGGRQESGLWIWDQFGLLPPGAHDITATLKGSDGAWTTATLPDGWVVVAGETRNPTDEKVVFTSLSYLNADGKRVSYHA